MPSPRARRTGLVLQRRRRPSEPHLKRSPSWPSNAAISESGCLSCGPMAPKRRRAGFNAPQRSPKELAAAIERIAAETEEPPPRRRRRRRGRAPAAAGSASGPGASTLAVAPAPDTASSEPLQPLPPATGDSLPPATGDSFASAAGDSLAPAASDVPAPVAEDRLVALPPDLSWPDRPAVPVPGRVANRMSDRRLPVELPGARSLLAIGVVAALAIAVAIVSLDGTFGGATASRNASAHAIPPVTNTTTAPAAPVRHHQRAPRRHRVPARHSAARRHRTTPRHHAARHRRAARRRAGHHRGAAHRRRVRAKRR
jgi:hypothetical protein